METDTTLVWTDRTVHLHTVTSVHMYLTLVIKPGNSEDDDSFRLHDSLKNLLLHKIWMLYYVRGYTFKNLANCLMKLLFSRILGSEVCHETVNIVLGESVHFRYCLSKKEACFDLRFKADPEFVYPCKFANFLQIMQHQSEEESDIDIECTVAILLVETTCILKRDNEVFVHDKTESGTC